jgi:transcription initiation factor TFIIB
MSQLTSTNASDVTFKRELQPEPSGSDPARCPNCGSFALYVDPVRGERVCDNCGFVVDESLVDQGPDWTTFEGDDRIRAGPPPSVMAPDKGLGSMVGNGLRDAKGNPIDARSVAALNRLRRVSQWTRYDRTERALAPGLAQLSSLSSRLGLAPAFRERAAIILRKAIEAGLSRGRSMDAIVASVVYLAAKQLGAPRGLHELSEATGVTVHRISLTAKVVSRELGVFSRASRAEDFVPRFASQLGLDGRVGERALALVSQVKDSKVLEANSPVGIAAGALYLASEELGVPWTQAQIARLTGVSEVTIRKHYRLLKESLAEKEKPLEAA